MLRHRCWGRGCGRSARLSSLIAVAADACHPAPCLAPCPCPRRNRLEPALEWLLEHAEDPAATEPLRSVAWAFEAATCLVGRAAHPAWGALCALQPCAERRCSTAPVFPCLPCSDAQLARLYGRGPRRAGPPVDQGALAMLQDMGFDRQQVGWAGLAMYGRGQGCPRVLV